jgi:hypothetical protein
MRVDKGWSTSKAFLETLGIFNEDQGSDKYRREKNFRSQQ